MRSAVFNVCVGLDRRPVAGGGTPAEAISVDIQGIAGGGHRRRQLQRRHRDLGHRRRDHLRLGHRRGVQYAAAEQHVSQTWFLALVGGGDAITDGAFLDGMADMFLVSLLSDAELTRAAVPG